MLQSSFLKISAREELRGEYLRAFLGAIIAIIPMYLMSRITTLAIQMGNMWYMLSILLTLIVGIFVTDIFNVGFMRSLVRMKSSRETSNEENRYNAEMVFSGFKERYGNTLKITFSKQLYMLGWGLIAYIPIIVLIGVIAYLSNRPEISELFSLVAQYQISPTEEMALQLGEHIMNNCQYIFFMTLGAYVLIIILAIPAVYKMYEYRMIPIIVAENPNISRKEAFAQTREIMHGYRRQFFCVELSFIGLMLIPALVISFTMSIILTYIAQAAILPYMNMTFIEFYRERKLMMQPEEGENNNEN